MKGRYLYLGLALMFVIGLSYAATKRTEVSKRNRGSIASPRALPACGDERDTMIKEYTDHGVSLTPTCDNFTKTAHSKYFTFSELNKGDFSWALIREPLTIAATSGYGLDKWREEYGSARTVNSGYRNPARNATIGGAKQSRHMYGDAVDFNNGTGTRAEWEKMMAAAKRANADFIEPDNGPCALKCLHADWRAHAGGYSQ